MKIAVIGSGIIGLTTALELQDEYRNASVTIFSDKIYKETTSYCAAGIFRPGKLNLKVIPNFYFIGFVLGSSFSGATDQITRKWVYDAYNYWDDIRISSNASLAGVCQLSGYMFSSISESITRVTLTPYLIKYFTQSIELIVLESAY